MSADLVWFKSSYSGGEGECVEVALSWTKSSHSGDQGECLEIAIAPDTIHIRDSKTTPTAPTLRLTPTTWSAFLASLA
ncbi:DUF397 domain-containing protein [Streptomyces sp. GESEQ-35]|uniref:DUF397 domain-containing protein n=1 Tax=Streptomyces sp. GESEQ-35 TaxID=2812657 RepID=UPI001B33E5E8|nr:DUF397 domain-containing protein [Streptomyces sp. GESEQ-35]